MPKRGWNAAAMAAAACALAATSCSSSGTAGNGTAPGAASPGAAYQLTVPSGAMAPTLKQGQVISVTRVATGYQPHRGDIIVFRDPGGWLSDDTAPHDFLIKRVVGIPGDEVRCGQPPSQVVVNGTPVAEPYIAPGSPACFEYEYDVKVPAGHLWVLGDDRERSVDSPTHFKDNPAQGFVPVNTVIAVYKD